MRAESTPVLVVGGGLAGLSAAVFLSWHAVPTVLVERHLGSSPHPRAVGLRPRTTELYRAVGLQPVLPPVPPGLPAPRRMRVESLTGQWFEELPWTPHQPSAPSVEYSPCSGVGLAQDRLEPLLRAKAAELGADLRLGTELRSFEQDGDGVRAILRSRQGADYAVRSQYLVAADGHRSPVREALGIGRSGRGYLQTVRSVLFRAPLQEYLRDGFVQFQIEQPEFSAFLVTYGDGRWMLMLRDDIERDEDTLRAVVTRAIGRCDLDVEIITTGRWEVSAAIAENYARGRVFLAGDAAHTLPPSRGGYGANVGIEDAHNLAWKLAAVTSGESAPQLLDSYDAERRPVAWLCHQQLFAHADGRAAPGPAEDAPLLDDHAMAFGLLYRSAAILGTTGDLPPAARPDEWAGQPGTRAPHLWLSRDGERLSTLDLFQRGWVLLAEHDQWTPAAEQATERTGIPLACHRIGVQLQSDEPDGFRRAFGLSAGGAVLIRPDGYLAWRSHHLPTHPAGTLTQVLSQVAFPTRHAPAADPSTSPSAPVR